MGFLLLRVLFTVTFSHLLRMSQARTRRPMNAAAVNYLLAALACGVWALAARCGWHPATLLLGGLAGSTFFTGLWTALTGDTGRPDEASLSHGGGKAVNEWAVGALLGGANLGQLVFLLLALRTLPAVVVFPVSAALGILVNAVASMVLW